MFHVREICTLKVRLIHLRLLFYIIYVNHSKSNDLPLIENFNIKNEAIKVLIVTI
jgi:hypothetical protein